MKPHQVAFAMVCCPNFRSDLMRQCSGRSAHDKVVDISHGVMAIAPCRRGVCLDRELFEYLRAQSDNGDCKPDTKPRRRDQRQGQKPRRR